MDDGTSRPQAPLLAALVDAAPVAMAVWDAQLRCLWANDALASITGQPGHAFLGRSASAVLGDLGRNIDATVSAVLTTHRARIDADVCAAPFRTGPPRTWRMTCYAIPGPDGYGDCVGVLLNEASDRGSGRSDLHVTEEHFRLLVESVTDYAIVMLGTDGRVVTWNTGAQRILGYRPDEVLGCHVASFHGPTDEEQRRAGELLDAVARTGRVETEDWRVRRNGARFWAGIAVTALHEPDGKLRGFSTVLRDLTQQRAAHDALRESETTLRSLLQSASDGVLVVDHTGRILSANARAEQMFGYTAGDLVGQAVELLVPDRLRDVHRRYRTAFLESPRTRPMGLGLDLTARRRDGTEFPVEVGLGTAQAKTGTLVTVVVTDITLRKQVEEQLAHQATHDTLTGLPNRALFFDRLEQALSRTSRRGADDDMVAVLFFDLDRFKLVNDSLGHQAGDEALMTVASRLRELLRPSDTVARFGGDEFAMLCEGLSGVRDATRIARRIMQRLAEPLQLQQGRYVVTPSIGIAVANRPDADPEGLLRDADAAMYRAKERGRARFELFDEDLRGQETARLDLEQGLRRAIEHGELDLVYQPIMSIQTGRPVGAEALVRWRRPGHGVIAPDDFIPVAEETGLIMSAGAWVITHACREAARWQRRSRRQPLQVSVNLSARQLAQCDLVGLVGGALGEAGLDPCLLRLEITENTLMADPDANLAALHGLRDLGTSVAIDDFGTGYTSLSRLRQFPVDALKVDRRFVEGLGHQPGDATIVTAAIDLAHAYGINTVAEGVETQQQLSTLEALGCEYAQGFFYARPVAGPAIDDLLS